MYTLVPSHIADVSSLALGSLDANNVTAPVEGLKRIISSRSPLASVPPNMYTLLPSQIADVSVLGVGSLDGNVVTSPVDGLKRIISSIKIRS